jgi:hypothetical protein
MEFFRACPWLQGEHTHCILRRGKTHYENLTVFALAESADALLERETGDAESLASSNAIAGGRDMGSGNATNRSASSKARAIASKRRK